MSKYTFKTYAWSIGTTSLRMADIGAKIEEQLSLLNEFWQNPTVVNKSWKDSQEDYYDFLYSKSYIDGSLTDSNKKKKTARQKTSGLTDLGLIDNERRLTPTGTDLLKLLNSKKHTNIIPNFEITEDEMIYFKQLLKLGWTESKNSSNFIRPYLILGYVLSECDDYLTYDEFRYLLPLCINESKTQLVINNIKEIRSNKKTINQAIIDIVLCNTNYQIALDDFVSANPISNQLIMDIGMNRDGSKHDAPYVDLYYALYDVYINGKRADIYVQNIYDATKSLSTTGALWRSLLFGTKQSKLKYSDIKLNKFAICNSSLDEGEFRKIFFTYMHLFKIRKTLDDYFDLNRRYIKMSSTVEFDMSTVQYTPIFKAYFKTKAFNIFNDKYIKAEKLEENIRIEDISSDLMFNCSDVIHAFNDEYNTSYSSLDDIKAFIEEQKYIKFNRLVDKSFTDDKLLSMLEWFKERGKADKKIISVISEAGGDCEDIPTIFEYIVGVIWYKVSNKTGKVLSYMNLSLDTNQLPKTHAGGFEPDIAYKYQENLPFYPAHTLLLECTLMNSTTQRIGELEPVPRHLGQYLIEKDANAYCSFVTPELVLPIVSEFRGKKNSYFYPYNTDDTKYVETMNIIPIDTFDLSNIIKNKIKYEKIYEIFMNAYNSNEKVPSVWRSEYIAKALENCS